MVASIPFAGLRRRIERAFARPPPRTRPPSLNRWVSCSLFFQFAALTILWRETPAIPSIVWTGVSTLLLSWSAFLMRHHLVADRSMLLSTVLFLGTYPIFSVISYLSLDHFSFTREALLYRNAQVIFLALLLYLLGCAVRTCRSYTGVWITALIIAGYTYSQRETFTPLAMWQSSVSGDIRPEYQALGDSFTICALILAPRFKRALAMILWTALAIYIMFIIPSRSAALFGTVGLAASLMLSGSKTTRSVLLIAVFASSIAWSTGLLEAAFKGTRYEKVFSGEKDPSWGVRQETIDEGMAMLAAKPFTGEWGFQVKEMKDGGLYIHNALDVWAQAGIVSFLLFIGMWLCTLRALFRTWLHLPRIAHETVPLLIFAALSWALARNIGFVALFFCLGYSAAAFGRALSVKKVSGVRRSSGGLDRSPLSSGTL